MAVSGSDSFFNPIGSSDSSSAVSAHTPGGEAVKVNIMELALLEEVSTPIQISSPEIARSSPEFHDQLSLLNESFQEVKETAIKSCFTPKEQQALQKAEEEKIRGQFEELHKQMEAQEKMKSNFLDMLQISQVRT